MFTFSPSTFGRTFLLLAVLVRVLRLGGLCLAGFFFFLVGLVALLVFLAGFFLGLLRANLLGAEGLVGELLICEEDVVEVFFKSTA